jgi:hypothetical protein
MNRVQPNAIAIAVIATAAAASLAPKVADAGYWSYNYSSPSSAWYKSIRTEYDPDSRRFLFDFTAGSGVNGYWLVLSPGPNPKGYAGELAILYLDANGLAANSTITPKLTVYGYNGQNGILSYMDGSQATGVQTPDRIFSSLNPDTTGTIMQLSASDTGGLRRFTVELDATVIQSYSPLHNGGAMGVDWTGVAFGQQLGAWFHPSSGTTTSYGTNPGSADFNWLTSFSYTGQASFDTTNLATQWVPAPGAAALLGLAGVAGGRKRRRR